MRNFYDVVDSEIRKAIPSNWKMISSDKLLGKEPYKIDYAFNSSIIDGKSKLINILVLDTAFPIDGQSKKEILNLRNYIISKDCVLIVICQQEKSDFHNDISGFVTEWINIDSPNYYSISSCLNKNFRTTIDGEIFEDLNIVIHDIWSGKLKFSGPKIGTQQVNLEIMKDECWKCNRNMKTVTGIVFSNRQLDEWTNSDWLYYNQLVSLSSLNSKQAQVIKDFVETLRLDDDLITPVDYRYSNTIKSKYWAAACPHCNSLRGNFYVTDDRMQYLHDLKSRINHNLQYYSIELNVDNELIETLSNGYEGCPHTCIMGWERS